MRDDRWVTGMVMRARSGEKQAWDALVERYAPLIWSICSRYRLERIAERTGCDVRRLADVIELLIAVRLLAAGPAPQPQAAARSPGTAAWRIS